MPPSFWKNKKVLITGHTGFKGSWLSLWLNSMGANIIGYALEPPSNPNMFDAIGLKGLITHIHSDIRDYGRLKMAFDDHKPEIVFHLAAQSLVRPSYKDPRATYETNVMGTVNLLESCRLTESVRVIINVTSDKCYENREWVWGYRENDPMGGHDPYSSSKGCSELVTAAYLKSYFTPEKYGIDHQVALSSVRAGNVIGGGDWGADRLIPDCMRALSSNQDILIRNPESIRPWQHVLEPLRGYTMLAERLCSEGPFFCGPWNFGPDDHKSWTVEMVAKRLIELWGSGNYLCKSSRHFHEARTLSLYSTKAANLLGWNPLMDTDQAVKLTVNWYKKFHDGLRHEELASFTCEQISHYLPCSN